MSDTPKLPDANMPGEFVQPDTEAVGYKHPPRATRFKPGQSGNKNGRPKGSRNLSTEIETELNTRVPITQNGRHRKVPLKKVIAKQLVAKAAKGEDKSITTILGHERQRENAPGTNTTQSTFTSEDRMTMAGIWERMQRRTPAQNLEDARPLPDVSISKASQPTTKGE